MPRLTLTTTIQAPLATVFAACCDVTKAPERIPAIKKVELLTPGPIAVGTQFKETRRVFKREATETFTFTLIEPHQRFAMVAQSCGTEYRVMHTFTPEGDAVRVELALTIKACSLFAKLFTPLAYLMLQPMKKCLRNDLDDLRRWIESNPTAGNATQPA